MSSRSLAVILTIIALNGWCEAPRGKPRGIIAESSEVPSAQRLGTKEDESIPQNGAFIFIEQKPSFTSEDRTAKSSAVYLNETGLVQRYACEDYQIKELQEDSLPVAGENIFKALSAISLQSLPGRPKADFSLPPSQAHPGHTRVVVRQSGGVDYQWAGASNAVPSPLQKLVQDSSALAETLKAKKPPACNAMRSIADRTAGAFVRADVLSADTLDEYRVNKLLKTVKTLNELDPILRAALMNPFCMIPVPGGGNPISAFAIRGESNSLPLLYNGTGYEISRYSVLLPPGP